MQLKQSAWTAATHSLQVKKASSQDLVQTAWLKLFKENLLP